MLWLWATWCAPCREKIPQLQKFHQAYANNERVVMLSLSLDGGEKPLREFLGRTPMPWRHARVGNWDAPACRAWGVKSIPALFVISPDGKIIAPNAPAERLATLVRDAAKHE